MSIFARHSLRLLLCMAIGLALQLHAATAEDIQGEWIVDGAATWAAMKTSPEIAAAPPEQQKMMETMVIGQLSEMVSVVTADKMTQTMPGGKVKTSTYKITQIVGDVITTEDINEKGKTEITNILVKDGMLNLTNPAQPGMTIVLKRKPAAKPADK
jgi:hypothetical protein